MHSLKKIQTMDLGKQQSHLQLCAQPLAVSMLVDTSKVRVSTGLCECEGIHPLVWGGVHQYLQHRVIISFVNTSGSGISNVSREVSNIGLLHIPGKEQGIQETFLSCFLNECILRIRGCGLQIFTMIIQLSLTHLVKACQ